MKDEKWPWLLKVWGIVFLVIYVATKLHTWMTFGTPVWFERHWLFWAAGAGWAVLGGLVNWLVERFQGRRSAGK